MTSYLLPCPACSKPQTVSLAQAGDTVRCGDCDAAVEIPTMRELKALPVAEAASNVGKSNWNVVRGWLFVAGAVVAGLAVLAHFQIEPQRQALDTQQPEFEEINFSLDRLSLEEAWKAWNHFRVQELDYRDTPEFIENRQRHQELSYLLYIAWAAGGVGLTMIVGSLLWPGQYRSPR